MMLLVGNRGQYIALIVLLFLVYMKDLKKIKKLTTMQYIGIIIGTVFLFFISSYVADNRGLVGKNISFIEHIKENNFIFSTLNELGGTLINTILIIINCPENIQFGKGITYIGGLFHFIPGFADMFPNVVQYNDLGAILNDYFVKGSGLGGSYIAEMYFNFGFYATIIQIIFGYLLIKCDSLIGRDNVSILKKSILYYFIYAIFMYTRGNFSEFAVYARVLCYFLIIYYFAKICITTNRLVNLK